MDEPEVRRIPARRWLSVGLRAAAGVALASAGAWYWQHTIRGKESAGAPAPVAVVSTYTTPVGRTDSIRLTDGSHVVLGPASRLTVAATYGSERRDVELAGEAVFEVVHDPARPFAVRIGTVVIQDRGTTFAVRDDGGEVGVVVTSGSVLLRNAGDSLGVELRAGDRGLVAPGGRPIAERSRATADDLAWTQGRLVFNGAPMSLVKSDLRRWYGIELQIADPSLAGRHLTAAFSGEPADQVLNMVGLALGARIERRGDTAIVRAR